MLKVSEHVRSWFAIRLQCFYFASVMCGVLFLYARIVLFRGGLHKLKFSQKVCVLQKHACASATVTTGVCKDKHFDSKWLQILSKYSTID